MSSQLDCSPALVGGRTRYPDGRVVERRMCGDERLAAVERAVERFDPDVVVYYLANAGGVGEGLIDGRWVSDCDPAFDSHLEDVLVGDIEVLAAGGATVVFATSPHVVMMGEGSDDRVDCRNATYDRIVSRVPGTRTVDLNGFLTAERAATGELLMRDFLHLDHEGATRVARWLVPQVPELAATG